jgi:uncharacterized repeat protein (TIGR01451 family)
MVAPIGSQVVLVAGVVGPDGYLRTNRRLEWSLAPGTVGQFVAVQQGGFSDFLVGDFTRPRKITNTYAVGSTSRRCERISRGTGNPADDIVVAPGQGWITVSSPVEGTSHVTVHAPDVVCPNAAMQSATIYWVDAQVGYPAPSNDPAGTRHVLTTTVSRRSNGCPYAGYIVRYEIVCGPPAGFAPGGSPTIEVPTNAAGQASAEIVQAQPAEGTNAIRIQVFRPGEPRPAPTLSGAPNGVPAAPGDCRTLVSTGCTQKTWSAAALSVCVSGPPAAPVGATLGYRIEVANPGDLPAREVVVAGQVPEGLDFLGGTPAPAVDGRRLEWRLGDLGPRQRQVLEANFRALRAGTIANRVEVTAAGGIHANHFAATTIQGAATQASIVDVRVTGPPQVAVGSRVTFEVEITNRGQVPLANLLLTDNFPEALQFINPETRQPARSPINNKLVSDLAAGETKRTTITFTAIRAGQLCHTVEVTGPGGLSASAQGCVTAVDSTGGVPGGGVVGPPNVGPVPSPGTPGIPSSLAVRVTGPSQASVGQLIDFTVEVTNIGPKPLSNINVSDEFDPVLTPKQATDGHRREGKGLVWPIRGELAPGGKETFVIRCYCERVAARAANHAVATTADGAHAEDQTSVEIREPAAGGLAVSVDELQNPVVAGKPVTYIIRVANIGTAAESQVAVTVVAPPGVAVNRLQTSGPNAATKYELDGQTVLFKPVPEIAAGQSLTYRVQVVTSQPGEVRLRAEAVSREHPQVATGEKSTTVNPVPRTKEP